MKKLQIVLAFALLLFSCSDALQESDSQQHVKRIIEDVSFQQYITKISDLSTFKRIDEMGIEEYNADFSSVSSEEDMFNKINKHYQNPELVITTLKDLYKLSNKVRQSNSEFLLLDPHEQQRIIGSSVNISLSKIAAASKAAPGGGSEQPVGGPCQDQMAADKSNCFYSSLIAGAGCGLLTPTFLGAVLCYGVVMAADVACHTHAENTFAICKKYTPA